MNLTLINLWYNGIWLILSIILIDGQTSHEYTVDRATHESILHLFLSPDWGLN
jgi:hypothetical protein